MAFATYHEATNKADYNFDTLAMDWPTTVNADDLLILVCHSHASYEPVPDAGAGFTELEAGTGGASGGFFVGYKKAAGTESGTFDIVLGGSGTQSATIFRFSGTEDPATQAPEIGTRATGTSSEPNPPSSGAPTGGADDYTFIAVAGIEQSATYTLSSAPTNYTNSGNHHYSSGRSGFSYALRELNTSSAEDPGAFSHSATPTDWWAQTIIIHPSAGGGGSVAPLAGRHLQNLMGN